MGNKIVSEKEKAINGISWRFAGNLSEQAITFIIGILLARILSPREYGLVGMVAIFTVLTEPFINSGFSQSLIRKQDCTQDHYSTVFYFNFFTSLFFYAALYFTAPLISNFFHEPQLIDITRIIGLIIIIDAIGIIQITLLTKNVNFKTQTKINLISTIISGILGITLAYKGFGVWSLVYREIVLHTLKTGLIWLGTNWRPNLSFKINALKDLFGFSSKLLITGIIDKIYFNINNLVIARYFSARDLGLFTRAKMFKDIAADRFTEVISTVSYPVLASMQDNPDRLKSNYLSFFNCTMYVVICIMFVLAATAKSLILTLLGPQWAEAVPYLQFLCVTGIFYAGNALSATLLYVYGKSGLILILEIITKILIIPTLVIGVFYGIKIMIIAMIVAGLIEYLIRMYFSGKFLNYTFLNHMKDHLATLIMSFIIFGILFILQDYIISKNILMFLTQYILAFITLIGLSILFRINEFRVIYSIVTEKFHQYLQNARLWI